MQRKQESETPEVVDAPATDASTIVARKLQLKLIETPRPAPIPWKKASEATTTPFQCKTEKTSFGCCGVLRNTGNVNPVAIRNNYPVSPDQIAVTLEHRSLWQEFFCRGTEMIVNRAGRLVCSFHGQKLMDFFHADECFLALVLVLAD